MLPMIRDRSERPVTSERLPEALPSLLAKAASNKRNAEARLPAGISYCYSRATAWGHLRLLSCGSEQMPVVAIVRLHDKESVHMHL